MRREWIEIRKNSLWRQRSCTSPSMRREWIEMSGMKIIPASMKSPSMRREWIEIWDSYADKHCLLSPSMRREWIEMQSECVPCHQMSSLPPCGGSGLKCSLPSVPTTMAWSPSMRREWIEMCHRHGSDLRHSVSLHAEGVD